MHNNAWLETGWSVKAHFHIRGGHFDYSACTDELFNPIQGFTRDFKYCNYWNTDHRLRGELEKSWNQPVGNMFGQQLLSYKLKRLHIDLKPMKNNNLTNISERAKAAKEALDAIQSKVDKDPLNEDLCMEELHARKSYNFLSKAEFSLITQRAKSIKLNLCDKNTKYFHSIIKRSTARNVIAFIHREYGSITTDMKTIVGDFVTYYNDLLLLIEKEWSGKLSMKDRFCLLKIKKILLIG